MSDSKGGPPRAQPQPKPRNEIPGRNLPEGVELERYKGVRRFIVRDVVTADDAIAVVALIAPEGSVDPEGTGVAAPLKAWQGPDCFHWTVYVRYRKHKSGLWQRLRLWWGEPPLPAGVNGPPPPGSRPEPPPAPPSKRTPCMCTGGVTSQRMACDASTVKVHELRCSQCGMALGARIGPLVME